MLFGYPVAATRNNWLHECVVDAVKNVHALVDAKKRYPAWPKILPAAHQATLKSRTGLRDRLKAYYNALRNVTSPTDRAAVLAALTDQNRIADLLSNACSCVAIDALHGGVHSAIMDLFDFAFELLTDLKVRDEHYQAIYDSNSEHVCPFCGTDQFDAPGAPREALDHYLAKSRYPFAAANLRNLAPMCHRCNSRYKLAADVLHDATGRRRIAFDPYNHTALRVVLDDSEPFDGTSPNTPKWTINFEPDTEAVPTWDAVLSVRERYQRDHLDPCFPSWFMLLGRWVKAAGLPSATDEDLLAALRRFEEFWTDSGMHDRAFLKAAVFRMLRLRCEQGNDRLKQQLRDAIALAAPAAAPGSASEAA